MVTRNNTQGLNEVVFDSDVISCTRDGDVLYVTTKLQPSVIDGNFNELDDRLSTVEEKLSSMEREMTKMDHRINVLRVVNNEQG